MEKAHLDGIRNYGISKQLNQEVTESRKNKRMLNYFGHPIRIDNNRLTKKVLETKTGRKRLKGRPRKT